MRPDPICPQATADAAAAQTKQTAEALGRLDSAHVASARPHVAAANVRYEKALTLAKAAHEAKKGEREAAGEKEGEQDAAAALATPPANVLINHGNMLYDWSQVCRTVDVWVHWRRMVACMCTVCMLVCETPGIVPPPTCSSATESCCTTGAR